jgi:hypothetical protein
VRAFGALRFEPPGNLLRDLAAVAAARPAQLSPYNVGSLVWGCARLGVHPGDAVMQVAPTPKPALQSSADPPSFIMYGFAGSGTFASAGILHLWQQHLLPRVLATVRCPSIP